MPWSRYVLGYHGCDDRLAKSVVSGEQSLRSSSNDYDWLGHGMYFWEDSIQRAHRWAVEESFKPRSRIKSPAVLGAVIDLKHCLNLVETEYLELVGKAHSRLTELFNNLGDRPPVNSGKDFGARKLDCAVFQALHAFREEDRQHAFDTVRAFFTEGQPIYPTSGIRQLDHIQICVRNPDCIVGYFLPRTAN